MQLLLLEHVLVRKFFFVFLGFRHVVNAGGHFLLIV